MPQITFPRIGVDGNEYSQKDIETWYISTFSDVISRNLRAVNTNGVIEENFKRRLLRSLDCLLVARPKRLELIVSKVNERIAQNNWISEEFSSNLLNAFNYKGFRKNGLVKLASKLNVKSCCYCNMNYTVVTDEGENGNPEYKALLQFDHFFDKNTYPFLSMSLYNLIPSCGTCNQRKSTGQLPIEFNPYYGNLFSYYRYRVKDPVSLFTGNDANDRLEVVMEKKTSVDIAPLNNNFHLEARYQMHRDIIQEIYDKSYMLPYYSNFGNFTFMNEDKSYPLRLLLGTYSEEKDFEKRPMSKFVKDIWDDTRSWTLLKNVRTD